MVTCTECGREIETRIESGKFISGCWGNDHLPPTVDFVYLGDDIWPICGLPQNLESDAVESFISLWCT